MTIIVCISWRNATSFFYSQEPYLTFFLRKRSRQRYLVNKGVMQQNTNAEIVINQKISMALFRASQEQRTLHK
jgi:hypothetical protein